MGEGIKKKKKPMNGSNRVSKKKQSKKKQSKKKKSKQQNGRANGKAKASGVINPAVGKWILVRNLYSLVTQTDLKDIFSRVGKVTKAVVYYNPQGQSRGQGVVIFKNRSSVIKAVEDYDKAEVDGRPMSVDALSIVPIKLKGTQAPAIKTKKAKKRKRLSNGTNGKKKKARKKKKKPSKRKPVSVEQLDREMDAYHDVGMKGVKVVNQTAAGQPDVNSLFAGQLHAEE